MINKGERTSTALSHGETRLVLIDELQVEFDEFGIRID